MAEASVRREPSGDVGHIRRDHRHGDVITFSAIICGRITSAAVDVP
jgi:hypothetical protein